MLETLLIRSRATPSEPPRRRGATSLGPERDRFGVLKGVLAAVPWLQVGMGAVIVLLAALVPWGTGKVLGAMDQQILAVDVKGDFVGDSRVAIERAAGDWIGKSYFATDLSEIKESLERRPWVESAALRRVWPDRLVIDIREKKAPGLLDRRAPGQPDWRIVRAVQPGSGGAVTETRGAG